jgi:hypothetical protein
VEIVFVSTTEVRPLPAHRRKKSAFMKTCLTLKRLLIVNFVRRAASSSVSEGRELFYL